MRLLRLLLFSLLAASPAGAQDRPRLLVPLYAAGAGLSAADAWTTAAGLRAGAREANPALRGIAGSPAALAAAKAGTWALSVALAERLRRDGHPRLAVVAAAASAGVLGAAVARNAAWLRR